MNITNEEIYDLTYPQKSIWLTEQFYPNTNIECIAGRLRIFEKVNFQNLKKAIQLFLAKNAGLHLQIMLTPDGPKQYFCPFDSDSIPILPLNKNDFIAHTDALIHTPFQLIDSPLYRFVIYQFEDGTGAFSAVLHHLISDAWTMNLIIDEVMFFYKNLNYGNQLEDVVFPSYLSFIESQKKYVDSDKFIKDKAYWEDKFSTQPTIGFLKKNLNQTSTKFSRKTFLFSKELVAKITSKFNGYKISVPSFFMSVYSLYFSRFLNLNHFIMGNPVLNRTNFHEKRTTGMFISTAPFQVNYQEDRPFLNFCQEILAEQSSMYRHLKYPYSEILNYVNSKYKRSGNLYDIVFSYQNAKANPDLIDLSYEAEWIPSGNQLESLMLHLTDTNNTGNIHINYDYQVEVFTEKEIINIHDSILSIIQQVLENPNILCKEIDIVSEKEKQLLVHSFNNTVAAFEPSSIVQLFEKQVRTTPNQIALSFEEEHITYSKLNQMVNILTHELLKNGVRPKNIVSIMLNRSPKLIIAILAVLKCGATYLPIEPEYPAERIQFMLDNSNSTLLISSTSLIKNINYTKKSLLVDDFELFPKKIENPKLIGDANDLAYIMYTSGSTGNPKAVMIRNYSVINFCNSMKKRLDYTSSSNNKVLSVTTMCFDIFVFEIFPTLLNGLHLVLANEEQQKNPFELSALIQKENICKILTTPSRIQLLFLDSKYLDCLSVLKEIILGGEPFPTFLLNELPKYTKARIYNLYGPTETTVYSTFKELTSANEITIGKPIDNTQIYILDKNKKLLPLGCTGEFYIGGKGVAKGYYKNEELTTKKFISNPYQKNSIIYNTGDLGKWNENGELVCLGRTDHQIKIRGYRVELGDIEAHIQTYPGIEKVVVADKYTNENKQYLCAYYIADQKIDIIALNKYLIARLPKYMIPSSYMELDAFPLTNNHKINRKALPTPTEFYQEKEIYVAPVTKTQKILVNTICKVLKLDKLGILDDIFTYSADSLSIIEIQTQLIYYGWKFKTQDFFHYRTVENLANYIEHNFCDFESHTLERESISPKEINQSITIHNKIDVSNNTTYQNILLTGCTGYLGIHLLAQLLAFTKAKIFCMVRDKSNYTGVERLHEMWHYYFPHKKFPSARIVPISCNLIETNLGLSDSLYRVLGEKIDIAIHSAAIVKYYGDYEIHKKTNVDITKNMIQFCKHFHIHFIHISTLGVSGNYLVSQENPNTLFTENDYFIGQNYQENVYIHSKFEAEKEVLLQKKNGLDATIIRVGNLTGRYSDGFFQKNIEENAFYNILRFLISYRIMPKDMLCQSLEFTPVDICASFIIKLILHANTNGKIFHLFNNNTILLSDLLIDLSFLGIDISVLEANEFNKEIINFSKENNSHHILKAVINDLDVKKGLSFMPSVIQKNVITNIYLSKMKLGWPTVSYRYLYRILLHMKNRNYINWEEKL